MIGSDGVAKIGNLNSNWFSTARQLTCLALVCATFVLPASAAREKWVAPEPAAQKPNPLSGKKDAIARGKALYEDRCIDCHGKKAKGDGPGAADLPIQPPDLSQPHASAQSDGALFWKISEGRKPMPAYGKKLSEEERWALVAYMRSLVSR